jgi:hypothetical protein
MKLFNNAFLLIGPLFICFSIHSTELNQYEIEFIIFKHLNQNPKEEFNNKLDLPNEKVINFASNEILINKNIINKAPRKFWYSNLLESISIKSNKNNKQLEESPNIATNPGLWFKKNKNLEILNKLKKKMLSSNNYEILNSYSWIQNIPNLENSIYLYEEDLNKNYGYFIKFYRNRFMHIELNAYLGRKKSKPTILESTSYISNYKNKLIKQNILNKKLDDELDINISLNDKNEYFKYEDIKINIDSTEFFDEELNIFINEKKRIFNNEIHYFDHPLFGVIVSVKQI